MVGRSFSHTLGKRRDDAASIVSDRGTLMSYVKRLPGMEYTVAKLDGAVLNGSDNLFVVSGGPVIATIVGLVTTIIGGAANCRLTHTTIAPAATVNLNAGAVAIDSDAVGTIYYNVGATSVFTPSSGLGFAIIDPVTVAMCQFVLAPGTVKSLTTAVRTGVIAWFMAFKPLSPLSKVVAAD